MRNPFLSVAFLLLLTCILQAQKKVIAVIGSSTAYGFGANPIDSSWVNLTKKHFKNLGIIDTIYNFGNPSTTTYAGMPTGFVPPPNRSSFLPDTARNVTKALKMKPDIVFISFPSNDLGDDFTMTEFLFNVRTMYKAVIKAGKIAYVSTTQPRDGFNPAEKLTLKIGRDSIMREYPVFNLDFYDSLIDPASNPAIPASLIINPVLNADGTHPNNKGHLELYHAVLKKNIFGSPLPLSLTGFSASLNKNTVLIRWSTVNEEGPTHFEVQRSADGVSFETIVLMDGLGRSQPSSYSCQDKNPLTGKSFYRLKKVESGKESYSWIVSVINKLGELAINKIYWSGDNSQLIAEIAVRQTEEITIIIFNSVGSKFRQQSFTAIPPNVVVPVNASGLATGIYYVRIATSHGEVETRAITKP